LQMGFDVSLTVSLTFSSYQYKKFMIYLLPGLNIKS
jgi:hypothetical protein